MYILNLKNLKDLAEGIIPPVFDEFKYKATDSSGAVYMIKVPTILHAEFLIKSGIEDATCATYFTHICALFEVSNDELLDIIMKKNEDLYDYVVNNDFSPKWVIQFFHLEDCDLYLDGTVKYLCQILSSNYKYLKRVKMLRDAKNGRPFLDIMESMEDLLFLARIISSKSVVFDDALDMYYRYYNDTHSNKIKRYMFVSIYNMIRIQQKDVASRAKRIQEYIDILMNGYIPCLDKYIQGYLRMALTYFNLRYGYNHSIKYSVNDFIKGRNVHTPLALGTIDHVMHEAIKLVRLYMGFIFEFINPRDFMSMETEIAGEVENVVIKTKLEKAAKLMDEHNITAESVDFEDRDDYTVQEVDYLISRIAHEIAIKHMEEMRALQEEEERLRKEQERVECERKALEEKMRKEKRTKRDEEYNKIYGPDNITNIDLKLEYIDRLYNTSRCFITEEDVVDLIHRTVTGRRCTNFYDDLY